MFLDGHISLVEGLQKLTLIAICVILNRHFPQELLSYIVIEEIRLNLTNYVDIDINRWVTQNLTPDSRIPMISVSKLRLTPSSQEQFIIKKSFKVPSGKVNVSNFDVILIKG